VGTTSQYYIWFKLTLSFPPYAVCRKNGAIVAMHGGNRQVKRASLT
jgi:hypothetical protein